MSMLNAEKLYLSPTPAFHATVVQDRKHLHYPVASTPLGCPEWLDPGWTPSGSLSKKYKRKDTPRHHDTNEGDTTRSRDSLSDAEYPHYEYNCRYTFPRYTHDPITARRNKHRVQEYFKRWV